MPPSFDKSCSMALLPFWKMKFSRRTSQPQEPSKEKDEVMTTNEMSLLRLPSPILMDIFSRLPIKTILQAKCVCKTLFILLSDPYFAKIHLARAPLSLLALTNYYQRIYTNSPMPTFALSQNQIQDKQNLPRLSLLTSCNGLICFHEFRYLQKDDISVCNPILGEYSVLPQLERRKVDRRIRGFGFSQSTNQYKVIQTLRYKDQSAISNELQIEVHAIGSDSWRNIGTLPYQLVWPYYGAFLNGVLHWYAHSHDNQTAFMCSFDLGDEQFRPFPGPPIKGYGKNSRPVNSISMGVSANFLYLCDGLLEPNVEIWIMKDYGVEESWAKEFVIVNPIVSKLQRVFGSMRILNYSVKMEKKATDEAGELLILFGSQDLLAYNVRSKVVKQPNIFGSQANCQAIPYIPSLISINKKISFTRSNKGNSFTSQSEPKFLVHAG